MQVSLSEEQTKELKCFIFEIAKDGIEQAKRDKGLHTPFLKQRYLAEWLNVSVGTIKEWEKKGLPVIQIDGITFYSKEEVTNWIMKYQK